MKTCYIVGSGKIYDSITPEEGDFVIAADGGYDALSKMGIRCDLLVGDLDSISADPEGVETVRYPVKKDYTDAHLAYLEGVKRGYESFVLTGAWGGREDHSLANIALLLSSSRAGHEMLLSGELSDMFVITESSYEFDGEPGRRFSVLAIGGATMGVSISGSEYDVEKISLRESFPLGVSNSMRESTVTVSCEMGSVLVIVER